MLRALTETVLMLAEFALDEVTDIQVAIDEIATDLIGAAIVGSALDCELTVDRGRIAVCLSTISVKREVIDEEGFGWHVIRTVTETLRTDIGSYDRIWGGFPITVEFGCGPGGQ